MITNYSKTRFSTNYPNGQLSNRSDIIGCKQKPFEGKPTFFQLRESRTVSATDLSDPGRNAPWPGINGTAHIDIIQGRVFNPINILDNESAVVYNAAYRRLVDKLGSRSQLGALAFERREAINMVTRRVDMLYQAYRHLRRGRFSRFLRTLGVTPNRKDRGKKWNRPSQASRLWLEYWFGWAPAVADIYNAVDVWQQPIPSNSLVASSKAGMTNRFQSKTANDHVVREWDATFIVRLQGNVLVDNPNLWEANRLGLVNPAAVAWELVPFSFLVDWFINVNQVISSYTDFLGLEVTEPQTVRFAKVRSKAYHLGNILWPGYHYGYEVIGSHALVHRELGAWTRPSLVWRPPGGLSWTRGITAISLLISIFIH